MQGERIYYLWSKELSKISPNSFFNVPDRCLFWFCSKCWLMSTLILCFWGHLLSYAPSHNRALTCTTKLQWGGGISKASFIARPSDEDGGYPYPISLHKFHFFFAWQAFVRARCWRLVLDRLPAAHLNQHSGLQKTLNTAQTLLLYRSVSTSLSLFSRSVFPCFLQDFLISLGSGSFASFMWMTSLVLWIWLPLPPPLTCITLFQNSLSCFFCVCLWEIN